MQNQELEPIDYVLAYIKEILSQKELKLIVFGAGMIGKKILSTMAKKKMPVEGFADNSPYFQNQKLFGIPHRDLKELEQNPEQYYMLVTPFDPSEIVQQLREKHFTYIDTSAARAMKFMPDSMENRMWSRIHPLGHFYSLYPDVEDIMSREEEIFGRPDALLDIEIKEAEQTGLLKKFTSLYPTLPKWSKMNEDSASGLRYKTDNPAFPLGDAVALHCMLRTLQPRKMIEVGSGYSSAVTLDTNEFYLNQSIELTFVEPYPRTLHNILKPTDSIHLLEHYLQDVPVSEFEALESGDVLFIDSTHVSKIDSDVNYLFFEIFPHLAPGVYIHLHDICYPFAYPKDWIRTGQIWNEAYLLRAFLQNNHDYEIVYYQDMLKIKYPQECETNWPYGVQPSGGSFWMRKK